LGIGQFGDAAALVEEAVGLAPAAEQLRLSVLRARGDLNVAIERAASLARDSPADLRAQVVHGELLAEAGRVEEADSAFHSALEDVESRLSEARSIGAADEQFEALRSAERNRTFLLMRWSFAQRAAGDSAGCEETLRRVLELMPWHADALNALAYLWAEKAVEIDAALDLVDQALAQQPYSGAFQDTRGWLLFRAGRLDEAVGALEMARRYARRESEILYHLGEAYLASSRWAEARATFQEALEVLAPGEGRIEAWLEERMKTTDWPD
jgi:tetratricopeptide (TPR) repeat protein